MTTLRFIPRLTGLGSLLTTAIFALRSRGNAVRDSQAAALGSQGAFASPEHEEADHTPTWPPPDGVYWGM